MYAIQTGQFDPVGAQSRLRSTPGQIQLSIERVDTVGEDETLVAICEEVDTEDEEGLLEIEVLVVELDTEEDTELLEVTELVTGIVELEVEVVLVVVLLLGRVATYAAAIMPIIRITRITPVCTLVMAVLERSEIMILMLPVSHYLII